MMGIYEVDAIYLDCLGAFDSVPILRLIEKLKMYGRGVGTFKK